jgi:hypothetical protein
MIEIEGLDTLNINIEKLINAVGNNAEQVIAEIAMDLGNKSSNAAPVDSSDLRGDLANPKQEAPLEWKIGSALPYARRQHEGLHFRHQRGGGPKFLEKILRNNNAFYSRRINEAIKRALGR